MILAGQSLEDFALHAVGHQKGVGEPPVSVDLHAEGPVELSPGRPFHTCDTEERLVVPTDVMGLVCGRSSHMREGTYMPGGRIDPGYEGKLRLEFFHIGSGSHSIEEGEAAASTIWFQLNEHVDAYDGRFS